MVFHAQYFTLKTGVGSMSHFAWVTDTLVLDLWRRLSCVSLSGVGPVVCVLCGMLNAIGILMK